MTVPDSPTTASEPIRTAAPRAILWDMDGTLVDSEPAHSAAFDSAIAALGLVVPPTLDEELLGASGEQVFAALQEATGLQATLEEWSALKHRYFLQHAQGVARREPAAGLAQSLAARGVPMALVSNSTAGEVALCLGVTGLDRLFGAIVSRADVARGKPEPEGYLLAARRLGVAPARCLVVEDSLPGVAAGRAAGMQVLYHPQAPASAPPGAHYLPPEASPVDPIERFLNGAAVA